MGQGSVKAIHTTGGGSCPPPGPGASSTDTTVSKTHLTFCLLSAFQWAIRYSKKEVNERNALMTRSSDAVRKW